MDTFGTNWQTGDINMFDACVDNLHWASKEIYHFFRATLTKIHIKVNHIWTEISYSSHDAHLKNQRVAFVKKEKNAVKLQKVSMKGRTAIVIEHVWAGIV